MKSYEEMAKHVLECRDKQLEAKKKKIRAIQRYSSLAACMGLTVVLGYKVFDKMNTIPRSDFINSSSENTEIPEISDNTYETTIKTDINNTEITVQHTTRPDVQTDPVKKSTAKTSSGSETKTTKETSSVSNIKTSKVSTALTRPAVTSTIKRSTAASTHKTIRTTAVSTAKPIKTTTNAKTSKETGKITEKPNSTNIESPDNTVPCFTVTNKPVTISIDDNMVKKSFNHFTYNGTVYNLIVLESYDESVPFITDEHVGEKIADIQIKGNNTSLTLDASIYHVTAEYIDHGIAVWFDRGNRYYLFLS